MTFIGDDLIENLIPSLVKQELIPDPGSRRCVTERTSSHNTRMMAQTMEQTVNPKTRRVHITMSAAIYASFALFGFVTYLIGASRLDVAQQMGTDVSQVSYGPTARAAGMGFGALVSRVLLQKVGRQVGDVWFNGVAGLSQLLVPITSQVWQYLLLELVFGVVTGMHGVNSNAWMLEMWGRRANPFMQSLHGIYAIGSTTAPLIVAPFLSLNNSTDAYQRETHIIIPYSIGSGLLIAFSVIIYFVYRKVPYDQTGKRPQHEMASMGKDAALDGVRNDAVDDKTSVPDTRLLIILSCIFVGSYLGLEINTLGFSAQFAYFLPLSISKVEAAHMESALHASFACNRFICAIIATRVSARKMLVAGFSILCMGNVLLLFFATSSRPIVWVGIIVVGMGHSNIYPSFLSFLEQEIQISTRVVSFFLMSSCVSSLVMPVILGHFLTSRPLVFVYINLAGLFVCAVVFGAIVFCLHDKKHTNTQTHPQRNT